ncbi:MAG TPA: formamidase [Mycobacterium sp.]|jgi:formamidase|nr:formamidase [Mycobacterium sp.]
MPQVVFPLDSTKKFTEQQIVGHNRWHWAIPAQVQVKPGDTFRVHCREWFDGAIHNDDSAEDVLNAPLASVHVLSGPIAVQGAKPGDLLIVDILDVGPIPQEDSGPLAGQGWGYTGVFATENGGGFLTEQFPDAYKVIWDFRGGVATSRHVPGVSYTGIVHPGLMGTAPSMELLANWNAREQALIDTDPARVPPLALPPLPDSAILGSLSGEEFERAAAEAARTAPPRENGGNQDIKNFTKGTRVFYPVFVDGANLSMGDLHFSQGDGEITFCGAIEMGGFLDLHVDLIKGGMETYGVSENAIFMPGNVNPQFSQWLAFSGTSVTLDNVQHYLDSHLSYQRACLHAIDYLSKFGYSRIQAYMILGSAPIEGRLSGVVDIPNSCSTVYIPTEIFDIDVRPSAKGPTQVDPGMGVPMASAGA